VRPILFRAIQTNRVLSCRQLPTGDFFPPRQLGCTSYVHVNMKAVYLVFGREYVGTSAPNQNNWNSTCGRNAEGAEGRSRSGARHGDECIKTDRAAAGAAFDAMGVQGVPLHETLHPTGHVG